MNALPTRSSTNTLSARAQSFVPISAQNTISPVGESGSITLKDYNVGQRPFAANDGQASHSLPVFPNTIGQTDIGRNLTISPNTSAPVEPGQSLIARQNFPAPFEPRHSVVTRRNFSAPFVPGQSLVVRRNLSAPVEPGLGITAHQNNVANIEAGRNLTVPLNSSIQLSSPTAVVQPNLQPSHQFPFSYSHFGQPKNVKSLLIEICKPYHLHVFCSSLHHS